MTDPRHIFTAVTDREIPLVFVYDPATSTVTYYDRRYAGEEGFTEHGQACGPAFPLDAFDPNADHGIIGWHEVDDWNLDARTVRLVGAWLYVNGWITTAPTARTTDKES
jgi:hypothetical protein